MIGSKNRQQPFGFFASINHHRTDASEKRIFIFDMDYLFKKTLIQTGVSVLVFSVILLINIINTGFTNKISEGISYSLNYQFNYHKTYHSLSGWSNRIVAEGDGMLAVFNFTGGKQRQFILPLDGDIVTYFNEKDHTTNREVNGIILETIRGGAVVASDDGVVIEVNASQGLGHYIVIKHKGEFVSVYKHLEDIIVDVNQKVVKGETIGLASEKLLFEIWQRQEPINPLNFIQLDYKAL